MKSYLKILLSLCILIAIAGCTTGSYVVTMASQNNTDDKMSMTYDSFRGHKSRRIKFTEGDTIAVSLITTEGSLDISIKDGDEEVLYEGEDVQTSDFTVTVTKDGSYTIRVDADDHTGAYSFTW